MNILAQIFGNIMEFCYSFLGDYGLVIVVFTLLTKIILLPVSLWTQRNSIKMVEMMPEINRLKIKYFGDNETIAEETQKLHKQFGYSPFISLVPMVIQLVLLVGVIGAVRDLLGDSQSMLTQIPSLKGGLTLLMPLAAGLAALVLGLAQNHLSPLQREQHWSEQLGTCALSVGISLGLGAFVPLGVGIYWIASNLLTIVQQVLLNAIINPKKYVDYAALEQSRQELAEINSLTPKVSQEDKRREKEDYKRFFKIVNKHLVFYSEKSGFYKYFQNIVEYLLEHSNVNIHYITNDPNDQIFEKAKAEPHIKPYYIGQKKLITLMMKMEADMVVMTTPDLDNFYLKRSYISKDVEYVYIPHGIASCNMVTNKGAYDNYDTVLCVGQHQIDELREGEAMYHLPSKKLVPCGYGLLDNLVSDYEQQKDTAINNGKKRILIAPSWQEANILESCIDELVEQLYGEDYFIVVRPHPEFVKRYPAKMEKLVAKYKDRDPELLMIEADFSSNVTIFTADLLITDWSGIAHEFAFATLKPALFINTPMKVLNHDYVKYKNQPLDITLRDKIGMSMDLDKLSGTKAAVDKLLAEQSQYNEQIMALRQKYIFNLGSSGEAAGRYILTSLQQKAEARKAASAKS